MKNIIVNGHIMTIYKYIIEFVNNMRRRKRMYKEHVKEYISPLFSKQTDNFTINCPLHYFAVPKFMQILRLNGFGLVHPENLFQNKSSGDFINIERDIDSYAVDIISTLKFSEIESLFHKAFNEEYKNQYILVQGSTIKIKNNLEGSDYDEIKNTISDDVVSILESTLWNYDEFCNTYRSSNLFNTIGILLHAPPGYGKTYLLRSYLNKLVKEKNYTIVQVYNNSLASLNFSRLFESCESLFPCVLFIEDIDIKFKDRKNMHYGNISEAFLETLEGLHKIENVILIATTNKVDEIDTALLRPGRFDYLIEIEKPSKEAKYIALSRFIEDSNIKISDILTNHLIEICDTFAELKGAFQYIAISYFSNGEPPSFEEISKITNKWKDTRVDGVPVIEDRKKLGLI